MTDKVSKPILCSFYFSSLIYSNPEILNIKTINRKLISSYLETSLFIMFRPPSVELLKILGLISIRRLSVPWNAPSTTAMSYLFV